MTELEAIHALQMQIEELSAQVQKMTEIHNTQYTDIMLKLSGFDEVPAAADEREDQFDQDDEELGDIKITGIYAE